MGEPLNREIAMFRSGVGILSGTFGRWASSVLARILLASCACERSVNSAEVQDSFLRLTGMYLASQRSCRPGFDIVFSNGK